MTRKCMLDIQKRYILEAKGMKKNILSPELEAP